MKILSCLLIFLLLGCNTVKPSNAELLASYYAECVSLGFTMNTEAFGNCVLQLRAITAQEASAKASDRIRRIQSYRAIVD